MKSAKRNINNESLNYLNNSDYSLDIEIYYNKEDHDINAILEAISSHIRKRSLSDAAKIKSIEFLGHSEEMMIIVDNKVIRSNDPNEIIKKIDSKLDLILYSALSKANKDMTYPIFA